MFGHSFSSGQIYFFENLLNLDLSRGTDSTGVAFVNRKGVVSVVKDTVLPFELMRDKKYYDNITDKTTVCMIGHNRAATRGGINVENAHPHQAGPITLAHNGSLTGQDKLPDHKMFTNDSKNIAYAINKIGITETWKVTDGAATLVWWDSSEGTLNFLSNGQRPFCFGILKSGPLVWTSDILLMKEALRLSDQKMAGKGDGEFHQLPNNKLITIKLGKKGGITLGQRDLEPYKSPYSSFRGPTVVGPNTPGPRRCGVNGDYVNGKWVSWDNEADWPNLRAQMEAARSGVTLDDDPIPFAMGHTSGGGQAGGSTNGTQSVSGTGGALVPVGTANTSGTPLRTTREIVSQRKFAGPPKNHAKSKGISEETFHKDYPNCSLCNDTLKHSYECAVIVDAHSAACEDCANTAHASDIRLI